MRVRLRDYIITEDNRIYAVAGYDTRRGIKAVLRYVPSDRGRVSEDGRIFSKVSRSDVCVIRGGVKEILRPERRLREVANRNQDLMKLISLFNVPASKLGVTGSYLLGLNDDSSDIDLVAYGNHWYSARRTIERQKRERKISDLDEDMWKRIYNKRNPEIDLDDFIVHEQRKGNRGMIDGKYFDLLYVRDWDDMENIREGRGESLGYSTITAPVTDVDHPFDIPAVYHVDHETVDCVLSFTHTYVGQALPGELIETRGKLERIGDEIRLIVGSSREAKGEWIKSLSLLS